MLMTFPSSSFRGIRCDVLHNLWLWHCCGAKRFYFRSDFGTHCWRLDKEAEIKIRAGTLVGRNLLQSNQIWLNFAFVSFWVSDGIYSGMACKFEKLSRSSFISLSVITKFTSNARVIRAFLRRISSAFFSPPVRSLFHNFTFVAFTLRRRSDKKVLRIERWGNKTERKQGIKHRE